MLCPTTHCRNICHGLVNQQDLLLAVNVPLSSDQSSRICCKKLMLLFCMLCNSAFGQHIFTQPESRACHGCLRMSWPKAELQSMRRVTSASCSNCRKMAEIARYINQEGLIIMKSPSSSRVPALCFMGFFAGGLEGSRLNMRVICVQLVVV